MTETASQFEVIVVGGGPAGIGAALALDQHGVGPILLIERRSELGGIPARYRRKRGGVPTFLLSPAGPIVFGETFAERLRERMARRRIKVWVESQVIAIDCKERRLTVIGPAFGKLEIEGQAIVLACGARESTLAEKDLLAGSRPAGTFFTKNVVDWIDRHGCLPARNPVILGSDLIAFSAAAKLRAAGAVQPILVEGRARPECGFLERLYFRRWTHPEWRGQHSSAQVTGYQQVESVEQDQQRIAGCDGVVFGGGLVPNTELALLGGLKVELPARSLVISPTGALSHRGWFAAGGILGGFHGAHWCYRDGRRLAQSIITFLSNAGR